MAAPSSEQDVPIAVEEDKICSRKEETPFPCDAAATSSSAQVVDLCSLSGDKPFFDVILTKSHVTWPFRMAVPAHSLPNFPRVNVAAVVTHGDRTWNMSFIGKCTRPRFDYSDWKKFVFDNNLKCDDACIFEVLESTTEILRLKVLILRDTNVLPPQLQTSIESRGKTSETAINLD